LNLQKGNAHHILWWGPTIDLDHYIQFNRRLLRQGNKSSHVVVHTFVTAGTVDESVIVARTEKDGLQSGLLSALTAEFGDVMIASEEPNQKEDVKMSDLTFKSDANQQSAPSANPFAQGQPAQQPTANPFAQQQPAAQQPAQQAVSNPFAQSGGQQPVSPTPAPAANPFAQGQPASQAPASAGNPFAAPQQHKIEDAVAADPIPQPDPASAPPNPFAQTQPAASAPVQPVAVEPAQEPTPAPATGAGWKEGESEVGVQTPAPSAEYVMVVPLSMSIPLDKLDKVMAAIGRALK
jgi:hypothetical protein